MPPRRREPDVNQVAFAVAQQATGGGGTVRMNPASRSTEKNPAAVALGRLGGAKGGKARAAALSPKKRAAIAQKAARARWAKRP